ncbi:MAG TPA: SET domain-containing protein-lysine N-methyltransferase [Noviherbaspirillum sp.]|uniref:SET domain-containing protein n=1 Tax=Noviherbaspirillum sp. TaxID=1926288 RepID=UPI002D39B7DE|nr:SET domain-containing protein-lysine N-methyltransferase [Noviherbaspirillum sp.]HYD96327.1 SET domain-containing protein-lysine N-methyltransferase [Noviherbaspirillum sp.]
MNRTSNPSAESAAEPAARPAYVVKNSRVHGRGVFATRKIPAGTCIIEYQGERITWKEAVRRENLKAPDNFHTFFFSLESGRIIDGGSNGNDARWINHACEPNCEAREEDGRVFIYALRDIARGEELNYDYGLILEERHTPALKRAYACLCGAPTCRQTLLAPKRKKKA